MIAEAPPVEHRPARQVGGPQLRIVKPRPNEPHFDDESPAGNDGSNADVSRHTAGALALALTVAPDVATSAPRLRLVTDAGPRRTALAPAVTPPAKAWVGRLVQALSEAMAGDRSLVQLSPHLSPAVYAGLDASLSRPQLRNDGRPVTTPSVRSLRLCEPRPGVAEVAAVVRRGERSAAMALRLEWRAGRWRCVALHVG